MQKNIISSEFYLGCSCVVGWSEEYSGRHAPAFVECSGGNIAEGGYPKFYRRILAIWRQPTTDLVLLYIYLFSCHGMCHSGVFSVSFP